MCRQQNLDEGEKVENLMYCVAADPDRIPQHRSKAEGAPKIKALNMKQDFWCLDHDTCKHLCFTLLMQSMISIAFPPLLLLKAKYRLMRLQNCH